MVFNKEVSSSHNPETIIGPAVRVEGNFSGEGNVIVEGEVKGSIKTNQNIKVGPQAKVEANLRAQQAVIAGEVKGNLKIKERLELASTARVEGDIETKILVITEGALLNGKINMGGLEKKNVNTITDKGNKVLKLK